MKPRNLEDTIIAWRHLFLTDTGAVTGLGDRVLSDLKRICHFEDRLDARAMDGRVDPMSMAVMEGKRQVYLTIQKRLFGVEQKLEGTNHDS